MNALGPTPVSTTGRALVSTKAVGGVSRLADLYQGAPLRVLFPREPADEPFTAAIVNTAGGLVGGDRLEVSAEAGEGASLRCIAQAAEKVYRSLGPEVRVETRLTAATGAWLEWLPQETIVFDRARLRRRTTVDAAEGAQVLAGEMLVFGREAHGESVSRGLVRDAWEVRIGGRLVWADALHMDGDLADVLAAPAGFAGARATATLVHLCEQPEALRDTLRDLPAEVPCGFTVVGGLLIGRWLSPDPLALRRSYAAAWTTVRAAQGFPARMPRLWDI